MMNKIHQVKETKAHPNNELKEMKKIKKKKKIEKKDLKKDQEKDPMLIKTRFLRQFKVVLQQIDDREYALLLFVH